MLETIIRDTRHSLRSLASRPTYALVTIVTLALVVGSGTAILAVANMTLVRPLPYPNGERLLKVFDLPQGSTSPADRNPLHLRIFARLREWAHTMDAVEGVWTRDRALDGDGSDPEAVKGGDASAGIFALFGGSPLLGRTFTEDETRSNTKVTVLSYQLWQRRFGGDRGVIGRTIAIDREAYEIVGVMPQGFEIASTPLDLWTPLDTSERTFSINASLVTTYARRAPGRSLENAQAELDSLMPRIVAEAPDTLRAWHLGTTTLRDALFGQQQSAVFALLAGVCVLALLACANLANLALAQFVSRRHEFALRAALGGSRAAAVRMQIVETTLLGACGLAAGLVIGMWTLRMILRLDPTASQILQSAPVDWRVQLATAALALAVAGASGVLPVVRQLRRDPATNINEGSSRLAGTPRDQRVRGILVATQAASVVLLLASGALLGNAFLRASRTPLGFDPVNVLTAQIRISAVTYPDEARREELITRILDRVRAVPGVLAAGTTLNRFTPGDSFITLVHLVGRPSPDGQPYTVQFRRVSSGYFAAMRIHLVKGRDFARTDTLDTPGVAVVSRQFADRYWPGEDPIGRGLTRGVNPKIYTVIGVVDDVNDVGLNNVPDATMYVTYTQNNVAVTPVSLVVRTAADPASCARAIKEAVTSADPRQPLDDVTTVEQFLADSLGPQRFRTVLVLAMAVLAVVIALVGIYGVTARAVADRSRELGVRLALGATPSGLVTMVTWGALRSVVGGMGIGAALFVPVGAGLAHALPNVRQADVWGIVPAVATLFVVTLVATAIPAARAAGADPLIAVRAT